MYILKPELDAEGVKAESASLQKLLADNGGKVVDVNEWGLRKLAYAIKKESKGYYFVLKVEISDQSTLDEFNRLTRVNSNVLRYLITVSK